MAPAELDWEGGGRWGGGGYAQTPSLPPSGREQADSPDGSLRQGIRPDALPPRRVPSPFANDAHLKVSSTFGEDSWVTLERKADYDLPPTFPALPSSPLRDC